MENYRYLQLSKSTQEQHGDREEKDLEGTKRK